MIALGKDLAWVGLPGEIFTELGMAIKEASPLPLSPSSWGWPTPALGISRIERLRPRALTNLSARGARRDPANAWSIQQRNS